MESRRDVPSGRFPIPTPELPPELTLEAEADEELTTTLVPRFTSLPLGED